MSNSKAKRLHKYHRIEINGELVWACALPDCYHFMPKHYENMVMGRQSICWGCGSKFVLGPDSMIEDRPRCANCRTGKVKETMASVVTNEPVDLSGFNVDDILTNRLNELHKDINK